MQTRPLGYKYTKLRLRLRLGRKLIFGIMSLFPPDWGALLFLNWN